MPTTDYIPFHDVPKHVPGRPHRSTVHRWRLRGVNGVRLQTCVVGGRRFTTREWLDDFLQAGNAAAGGTPLPTSKNRQSAIEAAELELSQAGV